MLPPDDPFSLILTRAGLAETARGGGHLDQAAALLDRAARDLAGVLRERSELAATSFPVGGAAGVGSAVLTGDGLARLLEQRCQEVRDLRGPGVGARPDAMILLAVCDDYEHLQRDAARLMAQGQEKEIVRALGVAAARLEAVFARAPVLRARVLRRRSTRAEDTMTTGEQLLQAVRGDLAAVAGFVAII